MFFYLLFPLLMWGYKKSPKLCFLVLLLMVLSSIILSNLGGLIRRVPYPSIEPESVVYIHPLTRLLEFYTGIWCYSFFSKVNKISIRISSWTIIETYR
jgi:peptidoglycan/LPS O-acetylase OafA/YrhL